MHYSAIRLTQLLLQMGWGMGGLNGASPFLNYFKTCNHGTGNLRVKNVSLFSSRAVRIPGKFFCTTSPLPRKHWNTERVEYLTLNNYHTVHVKHQFLYNDRHAYHCHVMKSGSHFRSRFLHPCQNERSHKDQRTRNGYIKPFHHSRFIYFSKQWQWEAFCTLFSNKLYATV